VFALAGRFSLVPERYFTRVGSALTQKLDLAERAYPGQVLYIIGNICNLKKAYNFGADHFQ